MHLHAPATADDERSPPPQRRESVVTGLAVAAVAIAAVLAAVMHTPPEGGLHSSRLALAAPAVVRPAASDAVGACVECGVVEAVVPVGTLPAEAGRAWQMRIRMDDGSLRTVEQRGALAAGSRVTVAGGSIRVLSDRTGPG